MSIRKKRSDAGKPRKPAATQREAFEDFFASQSHEERDSIMTTLRTIQRYAPAPETEPEIPALEPEAVVVK